MKLGFIGTGKITSSVVTGICRSNLSFNKIILSSRSRSVANKLKKNFKKISIAKNNQDILNSCTWIFLAVTPTVAQKIIKNLKFKSNHTIVSFISTMTLPQLKKAVKVKAKIVRAIPLPPISLKKGPVPIFPPNRKVKKFFTFLFGGNIGTGPFFSEIGGNGIALIIFALTLMAFLSCGKVIVDIKLIIVWFDLNFKFLIIFCPTVGVTAKKTQLQELSIS